MTREEKLDILKGLSNTFSANISQYKSAIYDEANTRVDFIDKFFELLDWDVRNVHGMNEDYRDVVREDKVVIQGKPKAPDYSFRVGGSRKFFVEAKKPVIKIKDEIDPAFQVRRYGYTAKLPLSILTDFEEFAVYDTRIKPDKNDAASVARVFYCTYDEYEKHFDFLNESFSKNAILRGSFDRYADENKKKKGSSEVDREFLKLIQQWREELARNIALRNKNLDTFQLNSAVQKIIDRIIFLRIAEDRGTEEYGALSRTLKGHEAWSLLNTLFVSAHAKYNSDLFKIEGSISSLSVDDSALKFIIGGMYYPDCPYEFSVMPIEMLGNIYEQFLGQTIRLTPAHLAKVEEKPEVRHAGGVYYTPQYIVNYIVSHTVGDKIKSLSPAEIAHIKVLDPACGSGSFLIGAYHYLLQHHLMWYTAEKNLKKALKEGLIYQLDEHHYHLTIQEKQRILLNNIHGVDIDAQAVEVTKLSLLLKLMENETAESEGALFRHSDLKYLPNLGGNIKCGNSLVESDYYDNEGTLFDEETIRKVNTFDWKKEFDGVFSKGGFDCVIGNPPYVRQEMLTDYKPYFESHYKSYHGVADLYVYFIEKGISLLKERGYYSIIVANKWMRANYGAPLRNYLKGVGLSEIIDFGDLKVFQDATTYPCILTVSKDTDTKKFNAAIAADLDFDDLSEYINGRRFEMGISDLSNDGWTLCDEKSLRLLEKLKKAGVSLGEFVNGKICYGIKTGFNEAFVIDEETKNNLINEDQNSAEVIKPFLAGRDIKRYEIPKTDKYVIFTRRGINIKKYPAIEKHLLPLKKRLEPGTGRKPGNYKWYEIQDTVDYYKEFENPKIIVPAIVQKASYTLDYNSIYSNDKTSIIATDNKALLAILNSKVSDYFLHSIASTKRGGYFEYKPMYFSLIPIPESIPKDENQKLINLVDQMIAAKMSTSELAAKQCEIIDRKIDQLVYQLYGLTDEEIRIVEGE